MPPDLVEVGQGLVILHHHLGKLCPLVWVDSHHIPQQKHVVWSIVDLLGIQDDLLELSGFCKTLDHLHTAIESVKLLLDKCVRKGHEGREGGGEGRRVGNGGG